METTKVPAVELFYIAPPDEIFHEMQRLACEIWNTYDDTHGYATEKIEYVCGLNNISSNFMTILWMFDYSNQRKLMMETSPRLAEEILARC